MKGSMNKKYKEGGKPPCLQPACGGLPAPPMRGTPPQHPRLRPVFLGLTFSVCLSLPSVLAAQETEPPPDTRPPAAEAPAPEPEPAGEANAAGTETETPTPAETTAAAETSGTEPPAENIPSIPEDDPQLAVIRYGTETEIAALIQTLKNENSDYLDYEIISLAQNTRNQKILSGAFTFFGEREKAGLEDRAIRAIEQRDEEANETVLNAVDYLGRVKAQKAAPALRQLLDTEERRFMNAAFRALGRVSDTAEGAGSDDAAEYLIDYYTNRDPGDENRRDVITALGATKSARGVPFLVEIALDTEERSPLRMAALESLAKIADASGLEAILACVSVNDPNVRSSAVAALGPFSGEAVDRAIFEAFRDSFYRTRLAAAQASKERRLAAAVPYLKFRAERDEVANVKDESIRALGAIGNAEAMSILESLFTERKNADRVRLITAEMLMQNAPGQYLERLIAETDEAKRKNQTPLYNGFLKIVGQAKTENMEGIGRTLMRSSGIVEKSYGLDIAANNKLSGLAEEIKALAVDKNASLARKARRIAAQLGIELAGE
jgi:HEAT repeat protein